MVEEVKKLSERSSGSPAMQGIGYRHLKEYLDGKVSWEVALSGWKRDTKRFAKRQETWFKAEPAIRWFDLEKDELPERTADRILEWLRTRLSYAPYMNFTSEQSERSCTENRM